MASKRHVRKARCERKLAYPKESIARAAAGALNDRIGYRTIEPYPCGGHWHVGHRPGSSRAYMPKRAAAY